MNFGIFTTFTGMLKYGNTFLLRNTKKVTKILSHLLKNKANFAKYCAKLIDYAAKHNSYQQLIKI